VIYICWTLWVALTKYFVWVLFKVKRIYNPLIIRYFGPIGVNGGVCEVLFTGLGDKSYLSGLRVHFYLFYLTLGYRLYHAGLWIAILFRVIIGLQNCLKHSKPYHSCAYQAEKYE